MFVSFVGSHEGIRLFPEMLGDESLVISDEIVPGKFDDAEIETISDDMLDGGSAERLSRSGASSLGIQCFCNVSESSPA